MALSASARRAAAISASSRLMRRYTRCVLFRPADGSTGSALEQPRDPACIANLDHRIDAGKIYAEIEVEVATMPLRKLSSTLTGASRKKGQPFIGWDAARGRSDHRLPRAASVPPLPVVARITRFIAAPRLEVINALKCALS